MRKILSLVLCLMMIISCIPAMAEEAAAFCAFITGKTLNEAIAIAVNPAETDVAASCTIGVEDFLKLIVKSGL